MEQTTKGDSIAGTLAFFASCIRCGDKWDETCQAAYDRAIDKLLYLAQELSLKTSALAQHGRHSYICEFSMQKGKCNCGYSAALGHTGLSEATQWHLVDAQKFLAEDIKRFAMQGQDAAGITFIEYGGIRFYPATLTDSGKEG